MHQSGHVVFALAFHRNHVPPLTDGDDRLPQEFGICRGRNDFLQAVPDLPCLNAHMAADVGQLRGGVVSDFFLREDRAENLVLQIFVGAKRLKQGVQHRRLVILGDVALDIPGAAENARNAQQLHGLQAAAPVCPLQRRGTVGHVPENGVALPGTQVGGRGGLIQHQLHFLQVRRRLQRQAGFLAALAAGTFGKKLQNLIEFQFSQRFFV